MEDIQNVKIIMVGSINVGKTSLVTKYATGKNPCISKSTKNASYITKKKFVDGINFEIKLWDTAGQERYKSLTQLFMKDSKIALLVYSIDDEKSFNDLNEWLKLIKNSNDENIILGVIANKSDLASENTIKDERGKEYAKKIGADWKSTSALVDNRGIDEIIDLLFSKYYNSNFKMDQSNSISISIDEIKSKKRKKKKCCSG